jgi:predicted CopG family antitoxin
MRSKEKSLTVIPISDEQYAKLNAMRMRDETITDVLQRLLKFYERHYLQAIKREVVANGVLQKG